MGKAFMWGFIGFLGGLIFTELTDGKPAEKVDYNRMYFNTRTIYRPYPNHHYYDYGRPDTFNNRRPNNNGGSRGGETTRITPTVERGETHTGNVPQNDRKKNLDLKIMSQFAKMIR